MKKNMSHIEERDNAMLQEELYNMLQETDDEDTRMHLQYLYDKDFNSFDAVEKEIAQNSQFEKFADIKNCNSFDDRVEAICSVPQKITNNKSKKVKKWTKFTSIAASFLLLVSTGLIMRFWIFASANSSDPAYNYNDSEITVQISTEEEIKNALQNFYYPKLSMLENTQYKIGKHNKSHEIVYILVSGSHAGENPNREIGLSIYLQEKYVVKNESNFHTDNTISIGGKTISIKKSNDNLTNHYYCGFNILSVRYYIDLSTMIENDYIDFLDIFLTD